MAEKGRASMGYTKLIQKCDECIYRSPSGRKMSGWIEYWYFFVRKGHAFMCIPTERLDCPIGIRYRASSNEG